MWKTEKRVAHSKRRCNPIRLTPDQRRLIGKAINRVNNKSLVARVFGIARRTLYKWDKRRKHIKEKRRKKRKSKITLGIELFILALRNIRNGSITRDFIEG